MPDTFSTTEFVDLVERLRLSQREFFRTRSQQALDESKRLEKQVDAAIRLFRDGQKKLF